MHFLAAYGRLVQSDLLGTITQSTLTLDTLCAWVVTTDLILTEPSSEPFLCISLNFLQKAMVQYTIFKTVLLYLLKVYPSS